MPAPTSSSSAPGAGGLAQPRPRRDADRIAAEGRGAHHGRGGNALDDPRLALTWLANALSRQGITLRKGEVVTTGTTTVPLPVERGRGAG